MIKILRFIYQSLVKLLQIMLSIGTFFKNIIYKLRKWKWKLYKNVTEHPVYGIQKYMDIKRIKSNYMKFCRKKRKLYGGYEDWKNKTIDEIIEHCNENEVIASQINELEYLIKNEKRICEVSHSSYLPLAILFITILSTGVPALLKEITTDKIDFGLFQFIILTIAAIAAILCATGSHNNNAWNIYFYDDLSKLLPDIEKQLPKSRKKESEDNEMKETASQ